MSIENASSRRYNGDCSVVSLALTQGVGGVKLPGQPTRDLAGGLLE